MESSEKNKILVADDEPSVLIGLVALLEEEGYEVLTARDGKEALNILKREQIDLLLADLEMPFYSGLQLLQEIKTRRLLTQVIIITGKGTISTAVDAMRTGAYDYLTKPVDPGRLVSLVHKAVEHFRLVQSHKRLEWRIRELTRYDELIGQSEHMQHVYKMIEAVADSTATVILTGESGTGKELVARAIHKRSSRAEGPFVAINCSAFPKEILENELFGHEKGAFTGALNEKPGCFELAHQGTLFLDEVGEMSLETQVKILRALEEKKFRRLGGKEEIQVDVRVLAATNRDLEKAVKEKAFREDLYYRLCVVEIEMPPLRQRVEDIPLLVDEFLHLFNDRNGKTIKGMSQESMDLFFHYSWPGNVRELKNVMERAVLFCSSEYIERTDLPERFLEREQDGTSLTVPFGTTLALAEKQLILKTLKRVNNNKTRAAKLLGISLKTLHNKLAKFKSE
jgi:DNA-binding NtrC family response regulator